MRVGVASTRIISTTQLETGVVESDDILDGAIVNVDVNSAAAILSTKLDLTAIAQIITPDADGTRDIGTSALAFGTVFAGDAGGGLKALLLMGM